MDIEAAAVVAADEVDEVEIMTATGVVAAVAAAVVVDEMTVAAIEEDIEEETVAGAEGIAAGANLTAEISASESR
ncbi:MAG: hypothetical protein KDD64_08630 [Bdellovibrionales bacterium]|nr:hypothetical protein [Bdellovibrionales bacterium]